MSDSSIVIIQGTVGLYTVATRCHRCFAVTLKYTEDSSLKILPHSLIIPDFVFLSNNVRKQVSSNFGFGTKFSISSAVHVL